MSHVMLSYSRDNREFVDRLAIALKQSGVEVWYDPMLSLDEASFRQEIKNQIVSSKAVLVVWSKGACESEWVAAEAGEANKRKKLLQAISEDCDLPLPFGDKNYVDLTKWDRATVGEEIGKIIQAVNQLPNPAPSAPAPPRAVDDEEIKEVSQILDDEARVKVLKFLAKGEISKVYLGRYGARSVAVKSVRDVDLVYMPATQQEALQKEVEIASNLQNPSFLRVSHVVFKKERCFIVSDFSEGETIEQKMARGARFSIPDVVDIVSQLSKAITEAHSRGLQHIRIIPSEIFVRADDVLDRPIVQISPINFAYFLERLHMEWNTPWQDDSGPFMAPEIWNEPSWFNECMGTELDDEAAIQAIYHKAHQFALGMLAWTMLEGARPFAIEGRRFARKKIDLFLDASESFSERVLQADWRGEARALARIVSRMVAANPAKRWEDMKLVSALFGSLAADHAGNSHEDLVKSVYQRYCNGSTKFYERFYWYFFRRAPALRAKFPADMTRQYAMLDFALGQLLNYSQQQSEPTTLSQFVDRHRRLGLTKDDFKHFGEALIEALDAELQQDKDSHRAMAALELVIWPGIYYLIDKCTAEGAAAAAP